MGRARIRLASVALLLPFVLAACIGGGGGSNSVKGATSARGPIKIWYSNNQEEVTWGKQVVAAWNKSHSDQQVTGEEIPAGKSSEEVIGASITAGNTPCLIFNTSPAAVPQFQKQGGLVDLDSFPDGASYIQARTGDRASQYQLNGKFYQMPWKTNPVMIFYNKKVFAKAGLPTDNPPLATYDQFIQTSKTLVANGGVQAAIWPAPTSEFFQPWFDFYPLFIAQTGGKQLVANGNPQFNSPDGLAVASFWRTMYADKLAPAEPYQGDSFADQKAAMAIVGPWAISVYGGKVDWGVVPVPTKTGMSPAAIHTFSDEKSIGMYTSCKSQATAWDFLKFATNRENDGLLLSVTGQMPMRTNLVSTYASYFQSHPEYKVFADQASRTVEVPIVQNSVDMWQTFRNAYIKSVITRSAPVDQTFNDAASKIKSLVGGQ